MSFKERMRQIQALRLRENARKERLEQSQHESATQGTPQSCPSEKDKPLSP